MEPRWLSYVKLKTAVHKTWTISIGRPLLKIGSILLPEKLENQSGFWLLTRVLLFLVKGVEAALAPSVHYLKRQKREKRFLNFFFKFRLWADSFFGIFYGHITFWAVDKNGRTEPKEPEPRLKSFLRHTSSFGSGMNANQTHLMVSPQDPNQRVANSNIDSKLTH